MGYIKKLKNNELVGGTDKTTIYPVTSAEAVFEEVSDKEFKSQKYLNNHITNERIVDNTIENRKLKDDTIDMGKLNTQLKTTIQNAYDASWKVKKEPFSLETKYDANDVVYDPATNSSYVSLTADNQGNPVNPEDEGYVEGKWRIIINGISAIQATEEIEETKNELIDYIQENLKDQVDEKITDANARIEAAEQYAQGVISGAEQTARSISGIVYQTVAATPNYTDTIPVQNKAVTAQIGYYTCTGGSGATIIVDDTDAAAFTPVKGGQVKILMTQKSTVTSGNVQLQFGSVTATKKVLVYNEDPVSSSNTWEVGEVISVYYDGTKYHASSAQGGSNKKIDAYLYGDLKTLAVGQAFEENEAVKTVDKQLLRVTKEVKEMSLVDVITTGDLRTYGTGANASTYKAQKAVEVYNGTETEGLYAIGRPSLVTITVDSSSLTIEEDTDISITIGGVTQTVTVSAAASETKDADIAALIAAAFTSIEGWVLTDNENGTLTLKCNTAGNNTISVSSNTGETGLSITSSAANGNTTLNQYNNGSWGDVTLAAYAGDYADIGVTDNTKMWQKLSIGDLTSFATVQNTLVKTAKAESVSYDSSQSGLAADNVQEALDEVVDFIPAQEVSVTYPASVSGVEFGTDGNWVQQKSRELKFIPYSYNEGDSLKIVTGQYACAFAFLTSNSHTQGQPIPYCQGTTRGGVAANSTGTFEIPSDCLYICVYAAWTPTSVLPESMSIVSRHIITEEEVDEKIEVVDDKYSPLELGEIRGILLPSNYITGLQLTSANWQSNNNVRAYAVPYTYKEGDVFKAVGNVSQGAVAFLKSSDNIAQGQPIDYCNGERGGHNIPANQQISIPIPQDCRCIYIYATWGSKASTAVQLLPTNMYISNESVIDADEIKDAIDKTYFTHAGAPKLEWHHSGFVTATGSYGIIALNQYDVFKISGFVGNEDMTLRYYAAGNVQSAVIFDDADTVIGTVEAPSNASPAYRNVRVNLNDYPTAAYVLLNTYQYAEHLPIDLTPYISFEERYPDYVEALKNEILAQVTNKKSISIFFIGNSLTQDTIGYLPILLKELAPEVEFKIYDWYNAGAKLEQQYAKFVNNEPCQWFSKCENVISWTNILNTVTINDILNTYDFDIVCLQEYSYYNFTEAQLITNFNNIVSFISEHYAKPLKYVCLIDQPNRSKVSAMYAQSVSYAKTFLKSTVCEDILNPGGALFLALQTSLDSLGDQGHLSPDGTHAQEGLPCVLQSYVHALWILDKLGIAKSIYNSQTRITAENYPSINVCGPNLGTGVVEGTDEQYRIAQQCAIKAYKLSRKYVNEVLETLPETI